MASRTVDLGKVVGPAGPNEVSSSTDTALNGVLFGNGSKVGAKTLDTSSLTDDNNHVPTSGVVKSALIFVPETSNAGFHNSIYRGKYLGTSVTAAQYAAIDAGTFDDLFIGDYWTIDGVNWRIAHFDYWYNKGDTACTTHHVVIVPDTNLYSAVMNDSNTTQGAYVGSKMFTTNLASAKTTINNAFGSGHILSKRLHLQNAVTNGKPSGGTWYDSTVDLMNEINVYGCFVFSPAVDGSTIPNLYTIDYPQFALFRLAPQFICNLSNWWLRDAVFSTRFAAVDGTGLTIPYQANFSHGVRPAFAVKA